MITRQDGTIEAITGIADAGDDVAKFEGMLSPGFVNAHCHLELSHMKGVIPERTGLVDFVQTVMGSRQSASTEIKEESMHNALDEMWQNGIAAVGDICNTEDSLQMKKDSSIHWRNFIEVSGFVDAAATVRLEAMQQIKERFQTVLTEYISSVTPHAPYSVSKKLFQLLNNETAETTVTIHNQEAEAEDVLYQLKAGKFLELYKNFGIDINSFQPTGMSSLQSWLPYFDNRQTVISVHNTFTDESDLAFAKSLFGGRQQDVYYCICINANKYIENKIPPVQLLRTNDANIILGTDSYASNWQLNILEEIKTISKEFEYKIPLAEMLKWATANGAAALGINHQFGSFEKDKKPGVVLISAIENLHVSAQSWSKRLI